MDSFWKGRSSFQYFHLILDKCNTVTAESLENKTVKSHPQYLRDFTDDVKLNRVLKQQQQKEKVKTSTEILVKQD